MTDVEIVEGNKLIVEYDEWTIEPGFGKFA